MGIKRKGAVVTDGRSFKIRTKTLQADGSTKYSERRFDSEDEAREAYKRYEEDFKKACRDYQARNSINDEMGFLSFLIYWLENVYSERIENTTKMIGYYIINELLAPHIDPNVKLRQISVEYLDALLDKASKVTESAGNLCRGLINIAIKDAVIQGYLKSNPVPGTRPYKRKKPNIVILKEKQIAVLLKAAKSSNWYAEILLGLFCGLRKGEIMGLKTSDFNLDEMTVKIQRQVTSNPDFQKGQNKPESYGVIERPPKTPNSYRTLRIPEVVSEEIRRRIKSISERKERMGEEYCDNDYISCQENGMPHSMSSMNNALTKLCESSGLPHITVHGLRHMYATILIEQGVPLLKISALLGHSSINTTFEYYCDVMDEEGEILGFLNNLFIPEGG